MLSNIKILITLSYGDGWVRSKEFMSEDLSEDDIVGFELVSTDGAVGGAEGPVVVLTALGEGKLLRFRSGWMNVSGSSGMRG